MTVTQDTQRGGMGALSLIFASTFVLAATNSVVFPLLPELQDTYGLPTWSLGLISATAFAVGLVTQLTVAGLADRGHAKALLLTGLAVSVVSGMLFFVGTSLPVFVLARGLGGLSTGCFLPAARALAATIDPARVAERLGRLASFELGGFVFGPVVGASLAGPFGLKAPFLVFAVAALLALVLVAPRRLPEIGDRALPSRPSLSLLSDRNVLVAALLALALFLPVGIYDSLWGRYLEDRGASTLFVGLSLALYGVPFVALASRGGRLADRVGPVRAALRALWIIAPVTALYGIFHAPVVIVLIALFEATVQAVAVPAAQAAMAQASPPDRIAAGQGLAGALQLAGAAVTALVAAPLYDAAGAEVVFGAAALVVFSLGLVAASLHNSARARAERA